MIPARLPNESEKAYAAFTVYCELGPQRSIKAASLKHSKSIPLLKTWSKRHQWQKRVKEYDLTISQASHEAEEDALKKEAGFWAKSQLEHRKKTWNIAEALLGIVVKEMKKISDSGKVASIGDICRAVQVVDNIKRLCLNLPTEKSEVTGPDNTPLMVQSAAPVVIYVEPNERFDPKPA